MSSKRALAKELEHAAKAIHNAKALIVTAGAGMGVDSGLPDFRGPEGFWKAYPPLKKLGIQLTGMSTPGWFHDDPEFAWGFFGHRYHLYKNTEPHKGFHILKRWGENMDLGSFVFTSNVDGHFQKAGFPEERVVEVHGSINFLQCVGGDDSAIWPVPDDFNIEVNMETLRAAIPLPHGPPDDEHQQLARPNILMFGDWEFIGDRSNEQHYRYWEFLDSLQKDKGIPYVIVEIGAGLAVPTVRFTSEDLASKKNGTLIRINPNEPEVPHGNISLPMKGLEALEELDKLIKGM